ncbi:MAG TPA: TIGR00730 family Rossman fold protein [Steroidobacteraceae bacterium]
MTQVRSETQASQPAEAPQPPNASQPAKAPHAAQGANDPPGRAVCVYCASSRSAHEDYRHAAHRLGVVLATHGLTVVYGGGAVGSMGALADGALGVGGRVVGILPRFMDELEWGHPGLSELQLVEDMRTRKHIMLTRSQAAVALPGGSGTLEELLEAITLKRLGLYFHPIVLVNTRGFFDPLIEQFARAVEERFMDPRHLQMWQVVSTPDEVPGALASAAAWSEAARSFAAL